MKLHFRVKYVIVLFMPTQLIFPLDFADLRHALKYVNMLKNYVHVFKIGLELFVSAGPEAIKGVLEAGGRRIFLDMKFHDIPETVRRALKTPYIQDVEFITVHSSDGPDMLKAAVNSVPDKTRILAVTVLTSQGETDMKKILLLRDDVGLTDLVIHRAKMAKASGCAGIVCSGQEISVIREHLGKDFIVVTPGVRPAWSLIPGDDQKRIVTPRDAAKLGSDYIVVGRPIRDAKDPVEATVKIIEEIS
ncbi:MAG TPA: orotidine-5'-phosphate decarboxylase [Nitrospirota bacterium]|nr:orotidine-5'-phosphate decarboxylase [Nitrospirota bacterium]